jgi:dTMP kinase
MTVPRGLFVTIEGVDGSGKTTQASKLASWIGDQLGRRVLWTREPGGWGDDGIREMLLKGGWQGPYTETLLFLADRCEHCARVIGPALEEGWVVICERYQDSTLAYQAFGSGLGLEDLDRISSVLALPRPDVTIWLDLGPEEAALRLSSRGGMDAIESRGMDFFARVRDGYRVLWERDPSRIRRVPADGSPERVFELIKGELVRLLCP